jgi:hypothetical protein
MKVFIDKQGGTHYHKADCKMMGNTYLYEEITHIIRHRKAPYHNVVLNEYQPILIEHHIYYPCPICFGDKR